MVRLICYNIEYCEGMLGAWWEYLKFWRTFSPPPRLDQRIIKALKTRNPGILALVEVDTGSFRAKKDEVRFFAQELGYDNFIEAVKYPLQGWLRLFHHVPILNKQANAIISKYKISDVRYHVFHEGTKRVVIEVTIHVPQRLTLLVAHLALGAKTRRDQIRELAGIVNSIHNPVVLMGDFNTFHGESEILHLLKHTHLHHRWRLSPNEAYTEPAVHPSRRLDYVLTSSRVHVSHYHVLNFKFSDHLPLEVDFEVMPLRHKDHHEWHTPVPVFKKSAHYFRWLREAKEDIKQGVGRYRVWRAERRRLARSKNRIQG